MPFWRFVDITFKQTPLKDLIFFSSKIFVCASVFSSHPPASQGSWPPFLSLVGVANIHFYFEFLVHAELRNSYFKY